MRESKKLTTVHVVCAVLLDEVGHVLIARRPLDKSLGGLWEFPGGKVEEGERLSEALVREIHEELGTEVVVEADGFDVLGTFDHELSDTLIRLHPIVCRLAENAPPPEALEHLEIRWLSVSLETDIDWAPGDRRIFAAVREWHGKSWQPRTQPIRNLIRVLFWMTFLGYGMMQAGDGFEMAIVQSTGLLLFFPALPLFVVMDSILGARIQLIPNPSLNWWHNLGDHAIIVLFLAINAWLLARLWRWLTK